MNTNCTTQPAGTGGQAPTSQPTWHTSIAPPVEALVAALDALDGSTDPQDPESSAIAWGSSGLGAEQVTATDIEALARLHHRLMAQIGRLIREPIASSDSHSLPDAGSLVPPEPSNSADQNHPPQNRSSSGDADGDRAAVPFGAQTTLVRRGWRPGQARTVIVAARFAVKFPELDRMWRAGDISADAIFALRQTCRKLSVEEEASFMQVMIDHIADLSYTEVRRLTRRVLELIRPHSADKDDEDAYQDRSLTFSSFGDTVLFQGKLPKLEGQAFQDTITAIVEQQRAEGDLITAGQRNADALTQLIINSAMNDSTPTLGGLPVAVTLTMNLEQADALTTGSTTPDTCHEADSTDHLQGPDARATYPDGDLAGHATARFALCCAEVTPITCAAPPHGSPPDGSPLDGSSPDCSSSDCQSAESDRPSQNSTRPDPASLLGKLTAAPLLPLAVGRTQRLATLAQRKALAVRDGGCVIAGCDVPSNRSQPHHVTDYSLGGATDLDNLASLCWVHHRQVDHGHWRLVANPAPGSQPYWTAELVLPGRR